MNKLEQYLDQLCQSVGGPWELRQHVRQEMREHLLDAISQHKAAGMTDEQALEKAIAEFGKPDEVRSELESTFGKRTTWIIDKALEWKEKTMRAQWLWTTWAYLAIAVVILMEALFITFNVTFIIPKFQRLLRDGMIDYADLDAQGVAWMVNWLDNVQRVAGQHTLLLLVVPAAIWGLFEWRVHSEHKSFMRLAALGSAAVALMCVVALTTASMLVPFCMAMPMMGVMSRPWALERVASIETATNALEKAHKKKDWPAMQKHAKEAAGAVSLLMIGPAVTSLTPPNDQVKAGNLRSHMGAVQYRLGEIEHAIAEHDEQKLAAGLKDFRAAFEPVRDAAKNTEKNASSRI